VAAGTDGARQVLCLFQQETPVSEELEFTGERFTPECVREIRYEHFHRYAFASQWCGDAEVLDAACGEGYGAALLAAAAARSVTGVDLSEDAIRHARQRYGDRDKLSFEVADATCLPFADAAFDRVVSFETLEHLREQETLLREFRRVLRPDGLLILSSPDKAVYSEQQGFDNEFHVRELYRHELEQLLEGFFPARLILGQKLMFHSVIWAMDELARLDTQTLGEDGALLEGRVDAVPVYFIALCAASEDCLPDVEGRLWLFDDATESVYAHYYHEIRKNMAAGGILAERDAEIQALRQRLDRQIAPWWRRWFRRG
jgi:SAM-dependent methyltransferase